MRYTDKKRARKRKGHHQRGYLEMSDILKRKTFNSSNRDKMKTFYI